MNELAGFSLQPSQIPPARSRSRGCGKLEASFSFPLFHGLLCSAGSTIFVVTISVMQHAHTTVNSFRASAILATCAGFLGRNRA